MSYAFVTGASSGIGREFARALALRGYDLVITARRVSRLEELATELTQQYGGQVTCIPCDLTDQTALDGLLSHPALREAPAVFINNAGMGRRGGFEALTQEEIQTLIALNVTSHTQLLHHIYGLMVAAGSGSIINVASVAAFGPMPYLSVYGASKAYVLSLSSALAEEGASRGVSVTALCPGPVDTEFFERAGVTEFHYKKTLISPERVVAYALDALNKGQRVAIPRVMFRAQRLLGRAVPERLLTKITGMVLSKGIT